MKYITLILVLFLIFSCNNEHGNKIIKHEIIEDKNNIDSAKKKVRANLSDLESISNNEKIKELSELKNLDILNGIKGLQFGYSFDFFSDCIDIIYSTNKEKKGILKESFEYQKINWSVYLYFLNDTLVSLKLSPDDASYKDYSNSLYSLRSNFVKLLGKPNVCDLTTTNQVVDENVYYIETREPKDFINDIERIENIKFIIAPDPAKKGLSVVDIEELMNKKRTAYEVDNTINERTKSTLVKHKIRYFKEIEFMDKWQAKACLCITYHRTRKLNLVVRQKIVYSRIENDEGKYSHYSFGDFWTPDLKISEDKNSLSLIDIIDNNQYKDNKVIQSIKKSKEDSIQDQQLINSF